MALSDTLERCVRPQVKQQFLEQYGEWFVEPYCPRHKEDFVAFHSLDTVGDWHQESCCRDHQMWDSRTPGKFKLEFTGHTILALNAKTYICAKGDEQLSSLYPYPVNVSPECKQRIDRQKEQMKRKISSKGLSKRTNNLTEEQFKNVLATQSSITGTNSGFIRKDNVTYTYRQQRRGLTYFYAKRKVLNDGVSTTYLDV